MRREAPRPRLHQPRYSALLTGAAITSHQHMHRKTWNCGTPPSRSAAGTFGALGPNKPTTTYALPSPHSQLFLPLNLHGCTTTSLFSFPSLTRTCTPGPTYTRRFSHTQRTRSSPRQDDVRTIFISGFPADVRDRELHNMLRYVPGYEACQMNWKTGQPQVGAATGACLCACRPVCVCMHVCLCLGAFVRERMCARVRGENLREGEFVDACALVHVCPYACACVHVHASMCMCSHVAVDACIDGARMHKLLCLHARVSACSCLHACAANCARARACPRTVLQPAILHAPTQPLSPVGPNPSPALCWPPSSLPRRALRYSTPRLPRASRRTSSAAPSLTTSPPSGRRWRAKTCTSRCGRPGQLPGSCMAGFRA
jgi:hypothetical protein